MTNSIPENKTLSFDDLSLNNELLKACAKLGYEGPTEIQSLVIPSILKKKDLVVQAQTGSGKTASFLLPILHLLAQSPEGPSQKIKALVLAPTRELALQITEAALKLSEFLPKKIKTMSVIGGESIANQKASLESGVDIVVATPGRLIDMVEQNAASLTDIEFLVLDEADKILDLGFAQELDNVLSKLSPKRQNLFFSATFPEKVLNLVSRISASVEMIKIEEETPVVENIDIRVIEVNTENKGLLLRHLIKSENLKNALVFVSSKVAARNLAEKLRKVGIKAAALHGDLSQAERNKALEEFKNKKSDFLVATDVAARGIDIVKLDLVINVDLPRSPADFIHRIGRTGRASESGKAIALIGHEDQDHFRLIEKRAQLCLNREMIPGFELTGEAPAKNKGQAPVKGKRMSKKDKARANALKNSSTN